MNASTLTFFPATTNYPLKTPNLPVWSEPRKIKLHHAPRLHKGRGLSRGGECAYDRAMPEPAPLEISAAEGRRLVLYLNGLSGAPPGRLTGESLLALIERLGFVQLDSVRVVERAQHMILFARHPGYRPPKLRRLLETRGHLFEHWTHDAAIIPTRFYRYWRHGFVRRKAALTKRFQK